MHSQTPFFLVWSLLLLSSPSTEQSSCSVALFQIQWWIITLLFFPPPVSAQNYLVPPCTPNTFFLSCRFLYSRKGEMFMGRVWETSMFFVCLSLGAAWGGEEVAPGRCTFWSTRATLPAQGGTWGPVSKGPRVLVSLVLHGETQGEMEGIVLPVPVYVW